MPRHNGHTSKTNHNRSTKISKAHASGGYGLKVSLRTKLDVDLKDVAASMGVAYR